MKHRNKKSPVVMWNSKWVRTGETKIIANQKHQKSEVPVRILVEIPENVQTKMQKSGRQT